MFGRANQSLLEKAELRNHCQVSEGELFSLLENRRLDLHIMMSGSKVGYVNPGAFTEIVDSILVHLNSDSERAIGEIRAQDILEN